MSTVVRLLEAAALLKPVAQGVALRQALPKILKLAAIGMTTSVIAATVIVFAFYGLHLELVLHNFGPERAFIVTFGIACMVLILFVLWLLETITEFKKALLPKQTGVMGIVDSFLDGLNTSTPKEPSK